MRVLLPILLLTSVDASAAVLHRCIGDHGETSYQQLPCASAARSLGELEFVVDAPAPDTSPAGTTGRPRSDAGRRGETASRRAPRKAQVFGYACSGSGRVWLSRSPCPPTVTVEPVRASAPRRAAASSATPPRTAAVRQSALDRDGFCARLRAEPRSGESVYMINLAGC